MEEGAIAIAIAIVIAIAGVAIVAIHTATTVLGADVAGVGEAEAGVAKYSIMLLKVYFHSKFTWLVDDPHTLHSFGTSGHHDGMLGTTS